MEKEDRDICLTTLSMQGVEKTERKSIEELGELITSICRYDIGRSSCNEILEEIADVFIMMEQLIEIHGGQVFFKDALNKKIKKLRSFNYHRYQRIARDAKFKRKA